MLPPEGVEHVCACVYMPGTESAAQGHTLLARGARELASGIEQLVPASSGPSWVCVRCRFVMQSFRCRCVNSLHLFAFLLRRRAAARCPFVCMSSPMSCVCVCLRGAGPDPIRRRWGCLGRPSPFWGGSSLGLYMRLAQGPEYNMRCTSPGG